MPYRPKAVPNDPVAWNLDLDDPDQNFNAMLDARILIVDDNRVGRSILEASLRKAGFRNMRSAEDGTQGLKAAFEWHPDLIVTDLVMPKVDGFDLCRWLRAEPDFKDIPIIAQTAIEEPELRGSAFDAGASDLILKPINGRELVSRVRVHLDRRRLISRLTEYKERMAQELSLAKAMQLSLLPTAPEIEALKRCLPLDLAGYSEPSSGLGGDLWGVETLNGNRLRLWNADFTGHGVNSALNTFRLHTFLRTSAAPADRPADWLRLVNGFLCDVLPMGQFATMLCALIDFDHNTLTLASAAAPPPIVGNGSAFGVVDIGGLPLGISRDAQFDQLMMPFGPGSTLFAYSDALIETPTPDIPIYKPESVAEYLQTHSGEPLKKWHAGLIDQLRMISPAGLSDDLTLISLAHEEIMPW